MDGPSTEGAPSDVGALYEDAPCGLLVTAPDGIILRINRTFCTWLGREAANLVGRLRLQDLLTVGGRIFHDTHWGPLMQIQGSVAEIKLEIVHSDGRTLPTVWNAVRRIRNGMTVHEVAVFVAEDRHKYEQELLIARRRAEELLTKEQEAQRALRVAQADRDRQRALAEDRALFAEQMMAIVSHDLRNPLSVIRMSSHFLALTGLTPKQQPALARLVSSNERATRLISDLLDFSRSRLGSGLEVEMGDIDFHALVREAIDHLRVANPDHIVEHRRIGSGACRGSGDRLAQLIGNLVINAFTYGSPERPVLVTSVIDRDAFSVSVHNEGAAIPAALLSKLFDPMTRGAPAAGYASSVGLGLFIVREIAHAHGGDVEVTSTNENGTTFQATFPRPNTAGKDPATRHSE